MSSVHNETQRTKAIAYLRSRGKYIIDHDCAFKPTCAAATDVRRTWREALSNMAYEQAKISVIHRWERK